MLRELVDYAGSDGVRCDVRARHHLFGSDQVHRPKSLRRAQLAPSWPLIFSRPTRSRGGIMVLALFLSQFKTMHPMLRLLVCGAIAGAPCLLILMQPDLGEVIIWVPVLLALLFVGRNAVCAT